MKKYHMIFIMTVYCMLFFAHGDCSASVFDDLPQPPVPIPINERGLPTVEGEKYAVAGNDRQSLEGAVFDRQDNLLFSDITGRRILQATPEGKVENYLTLENLMPCGLAFHRDGRLFICAVEPDWKSGAIIAVSPDRKHIETILPASKGYLPNDVVFDRQGGIYFSDFRGTSTEPKGGVYYLPPDFSSVMPVIPKMSQANGVALSPDGKTLWATEYARNLLHRVILSSPTTSPINGTKIAYHFTGPAPDSMRVDAKGNVYVAMVGQGRILIFNANGMPVGQILLPERDLGNNLRSTSLAVHPEKKEVAIVAGNTLDAPSSEAAIFTAPAFARGLSPLPAKND